MLTNIEAERVRKQLTREELAMQLNVSTRTYYNWIKEDSDIPSSKLCDMSEIFGVSMKYLLGRERKTSIKGFRRQDTKEVE